MALKLVDSSECGSTKKKSKLPFQRDDSLLFSVVLMLFYSDFTTGVAAGAGVVAAVLVLFLAQQPEPPIADFCAAEHSVLAAVFLAFLASLSPAEAVPTKANRARASNAFFMGKMRRR